jgi:hypothetical protein
MRRDSRDLVVWKREWNEGVLGIESDMVKATEISNLKPVMSCLFRLWLCGFVESVCHIT